MQTLWIEKIYMANNDNIKDDRQTLSPPLNTAQAWRPVCLVRLGAGFH